MNSLREMMAKKRKDGQAMKEKLRAAGIDTTGMDFSGGFDSTDSGCAFLTPTRC
jgi:hypothetical protein